MENMTISNLTPQIASLSGTIIDYGILKQGAETNVILELISENTLHHLNINWSCGCTTPSVSAFPPNKIELKISYDSNLLGYFNKSITETYIENGQQNQIQFNITGTITQ